MTREPLALVAAVPPLVVGAAHFNDALAHALAQKAPLELVSWRRAYPPLLYRAREHEGKPTGAEFVLDWANPLSWRAAALRIERAGARSVILPWLHPIVTPPYLYLLNRLRNRRRVVICHNVIPHDSGRTALAVTRRVLARADLFVTHAAHQVDELAALGFGSKPVLELFHPRFVARQADASAVAALRSELGDPSLLVLCFGAVRPYKGFDLALRAVAETPGVAIVVAGRFWQGSDGYRRLADELGLGDRATLIDRYIPDDEAAVLFAAADAVVLPYRMASQSGVAQLAFAHGKPVVATAVGGLPAAVVDGVDGLLVPPNDVPALAAALERVSRDRELLTAGVEATAAGHSFDRYAELLVEALR